VCPTVVQQGGTLIQSMIMAPSSPHLGPIRPHRALRPSFRARRLIGRLLCTLPPMLQSKLCWAPAIPPKKQLAENWQAKAREWKEAVAKHDH
jgi:hypothetical protein